MQFSKSQDIIVKKKSQETISLRTKLHFIRWLEEIKIKEKISFLIVDDMYMWNILIFIFLLSSNIRPYYYKLFKTSSERRLLS